MSAKELWAKQIFQGYFVRFSVINKLMTAYSSESLRQHNARLKRDTYNSSQNNAGSKKGTCLISFSANTFQYTIVITYTWQFILKTKVTLRKVIECYFRLIKEAMLFLY